MATRRRYDDSCGLAQALNVVGERWALLVVRELLLGARRFTDLRAALPGISPNVLSQRLEELEAAGVLRRRRLRPPAATSVYELTSWGAELEHVVIRLGYWGARSPSFDASRPLSASSAVISMRTMFRPEAAGGVDVVVGIDTDQRWFRAEVAGGAFAVEQVDDEPADADALVAGGPDDLAALLYAEDPDAVIAAEAVAVRGDRGALRRYLACFRLPEPAEAPPS